MDSCLRGSSQWIYIRRPKVNAYQLCMCPIDLEMSGGFIALRMSGFRGQALGGVADEGRVRLSGRNPSPLTTPSPQPRIPQTPAQRLSFPHTHNTTSAHTPPPHPFPKRRKRIRIRTHRHPMRHRIEMHVMHMPLEIFFIPDLMPGAMATPPAPHLVWAHS